jgi:succinate-semialdehyde dehydrogenase/glutarate-semialdehyde dehydrogenase
MFSVYPDLALYIDGQWLARGGRETEDVINPATEKSLGVLSHATTADLDHALAAADKGFKIWRSVSAYERATVLRRAANLVRQRLDVIAHALTLEQGKILAEAQTEIAVSADIIEWCAEEGRRSYGRVIPARNRGSQQMMIQEPVGAVAAFTPWNFPILTPARKIGGALAAGCSIILKASEETPASCVEFVRAFADAGLPAGVLNLVFGTPSQVSEHLIPSNVIRKISFTGSVPVGKHLGKLAAASMKRATLELGGHSPVIIFDDIDPAKAAELSVAGKYRNAGQVCTSPTRFYVHETVYDRFVERFVDLAKNLPFGDGLAKKSKMGPLANRRRLDAMEGLVNDARKKGAVIAAGGNRHGPQGFFFEPTVITGVPKDARVMKEEPFGPIAPITPFRTFDEVVESANSLPFGLAAYAFTRSAKTAIQIADALESGMVGINTFSVSTPETPFGGTKDSGYGQEGGIEGIEAYTNKKFVSHLASAP